VWRRLLYCVFVLLLALPVHVYSQEVTFITSNTVEGNKTKKTLQVEHCKDSKISVCHLLGCD
jgi:hypothetical protein